MSVPAALTNLYRRAMMLVGRGVITAGRDDGLVQLQQVQINDAETIDNLPRLAEYGFTSMPIPGCDATLLFGGGDRSNGVIVATGDKRYRLKSLAPGEVALYDNVGQVVRLTPSGIIVTSPLSVAIKAGQTLHLEADVVEIVARTALRKDVHGYADELRWMGGTTWQSSSWYIGATVTSVTFAIDPPLHFPSPI